MPGGKSRWSQGKDLSWEPLRPELVVEVAYDHCRASASGTPHSSGASAARKPVPPAATTRSSRSCPRGRSPRSSGGVVSLAGTPGSAGRARGARRIVVGVGRVLRGAFGFGDVPQVDAHARPGGRAAAHRSTSTSSTASSRAASGYLAFQRSRPASAASLSGELAMDEQRILRAARRAAPLARDGATRVPSPLVL